MKRVGLVLALVVLLLAAGAGGAFLVGGRPLLKKLPQLHLPVFGGAPKPVMVSVPSITTNLIGASADHFAQVAFTLQLSSSTVARRFSQRRAAVLDAVIADVRRESPSTLGGASGMHILGGLISASLDRVLGQPRAVRAVFFTQFVVE